MEFSGGVDELAHELDQRLRTLARIVRRLAASPGLVLARSDGGTTPHPSVGSSRPTMGPHRARRAERAPTLATPAPVSPSPAPGDELTRLAPPPVPGHGRLSDAAHRSPTHSTRTSSTPPHESEFDPLQQPRAVWAVAFACVVAFMDSGSSTRSSPPSPTTSTPPPARCRCFTSYFAMTGLSTLVGGWVSAASARAARCSPGCCWSSCSARWPARRQRRRDRRLPGSAGGLGTHSSSPPRWRSSSAPRARGLASAIVLFEAALGLGIASGPLLGGLLGGSRGAGRSSAPRAYGRSASSHRHAARPGPEPARPRRLHRPDPRAARPPAARHGGARPSSTTSASSRCSPTRRSRSTSGSTSSGSCSSAGACCSR